MVDISIALKEYHGDRFQPSELAWMKKTCFFAGLRENNKYLVSHLKDQDDVDPVFMLKEIRECDESRYPVTVLLRMQAIMSRKTMTDTTMEAIRLHG